MKTETIFDVFNIPNADTTTPPSLLFKTLFTDHPITSFSFTDMDDEYIINRSTHKEVSPIVMTLLKRDNYRPDATNYPNLYALSTSSIKRLGDILFYKYGENWKRMFIALTKQYEPLENYDMSETETPNLSVKHKVSDNYQTTDNHEENTNITTKHQVSSDFKEANIVKVTTDLTVENEGSDSDTSVYAFNSATGVPAEKTHTAGTTTTTGNGNDNKTESESTQTGYKEDVVSGDADNNYYENTHSQTGYTEDETTGTRGLTRHGNIGVTTSQQMLQSEIDLRASVVLREIIYKDVDSVITTGRYIESITDDLIRIYI